MSIETPHDVTEARKALGLTQAELGALLRLRSEDKANLERTVQRWESEAGSLPGPARVALEALARGWKPDPARAVTDAGKARKTLGLTLTRAAEALHMAKNGERTLRRWEKGGFIPGPAALAYESMLAERQGEG